MPWGPDVETNLAISSANHLKVRFIQQSPARFKSCNTQQMPIDCSRFNRCNKRKLCC
nr:hypothetical protein [Arsenophonus endosymbiont of Aphis craccivora]